jgi:hypothetical protein
LAQAGAGVFSLLTPAEELRKVKGQVGQALATPVAGCKFAAVQIAALWGNMALLA